MKRALLAELKRLLRAHPEGAALVASVNDAALADLAIKVAAIVKDEPAPRPYHD